MTQGEIISTPHKNTSSAQMQYTVSSVQYDTIGVKLPIYNVQQ